MLTELGTLGPSDSSLLTLPGYPLDTSEFQYMESPIRDPYSIQMPQPSPPPSPQKTNNSSCLPSLLYPQNSSDLSQPFLDCTSHYENDLVSLDRVTSYDDLKYDDMKYDSLQYDDMLGESSSSPGLFPATPQQSSDLSAAEYSPPEPTENTSFSETASPNPEETCVGKGKVNELQRTTLDAIFQVTDRPSRNLLVYIASELHLHHVTVKNFFSNARRRVRRAAARLNDPERSRRENRRRKEKRRLAALAAQAAANGQLPADSSNSQSSPKSQGESMREQTTVSPERRALMEKLADKVQRSAAQRNLASLPEFSNITCSPELGQCSWPQNILQDALDYETEPWDLNQLL